MVSESWEFYAAALGAMSSLATTRINQKLQSIPHSLAYQATADAKNVVIIGGSYAGARLAQRLTETLPTGYRAVLIERNSHFNHFFVFPRFGVVKGREEAAFIPYDNLTKGAPQGIFQHIRATATEITPKKVKLSNGDEIEYEYLTVATGSWQPAPSKFDVLEKRDGVKAFQATQKAVEAAKTIAVVGGGPVGVQLASDIKSYYPNKEVELVHSRQSVMNAFGPRLQGVVADSLKNLGVSVLLGERPSVKAGSSVAEKGRNVGPGNLMFANGSQKAYDLVLPCTGQRPNSNILCQLLPSAIDPKSGQILVRPTLQVNPDSASEKTDSANTATSNRIFSLGDVAQTGGPRFARAARAQAEVVTSNILSLIQGQKEKLVEYQPAMYEGAIKLTLGKEDYVFCGRTADGREIMKFGKEKSMNEDFELASAWKELRARFNVPAPAVTATSTPAAAPTAKASAATSAPSPIRSGWEERAAAFEKHKERFNAQWGTAR